MSAIAAILTTATSDPEFLAGFEAVHEAGASRGPHGDASYVQPPVALGARLLATTAHERTATVARGANGAVAVAAGAVYGLDDLAAGLGTSAAALRTWSPAETVLRAYERWGADAPAHLIGELAFCVWDQNTREFLAARDQIGIRQLFYFWDGARLIVADNLPQIVAHPDVPRDPDWDHIAYFLLAEVGHHHMGAATCFRAIKRLPPGHVLQVRGNGLEVRPYWRPTHTRSTRFASDAEYGEAFREVLTTAIRDRMRDVDALGSNLSGGLDSSSIVLLADRLRPADAPPLPTFSGLFTVEQYDESEAVQAILATTNTRRHVIYPEREGLFDTLDDFFDAYGEPTIALSALVFWMFKQGPAREGVRVVLNGVGADELLIGSLHYFADLLRAGRWRQLRRELAAYQRYDTFYYGASDRTLLYRYALRPLVPESVKRMRRALSGASPPKWLRPDFVARSNVLTRLHAKPPRRFLHVFDQQMYETLFFNYSPHLLQYEDTAAPHFGLESRFPFLDPRVVEFIFAIPREQKLREGVPKVVLRSAMKGLMPDAMRTKVQKSGIPLLIDRWQTETYRDRIEASLKDGILKDNPILVDGALEQLFDRYTNGQHDLRALVWKAFHLENWLRRFTAGARGVLSRAT